MLLVAIGACGDSTTGESVISPPPSPKVVTRTSPASSAECPQGGSIVSSGVDNNANGALDDSEISNRTVICNAGATTRFRTEPEGPHCIAGGLAFLLGVDRNGDGVLNDDEVLQIEYECSEILSRDVTVGSDANVAALAKIRVINGHVVVAATSLAELVLPQLTNVTGGIFIDDNPLLTRVSLPALEGVDDVVRLRNDQALATVEAPALRRVKQLEISVTALPDLAGFPVLQTADTGIILRDNRTLQSMRLPGLSSIGGRLEVARNPGLTTLSLAVAGQLDAVLVLENGLQTLNLTLDSVKGVGISGNPQLATARVVAQQLGSIGIGSNASLTQLTIDTQKVNGEVSIEGNASLHSFEFLNRSGTIGSLTLTGPLEDTPPFDVEGDCTIHRTHLTRLRLFRCGGLLNLRDNAELTGPISAHALNTVFITGSHAMEVLTLDTPQVELPGVLAAVGNDALREIDLGSITSIREGLEVVNSPAFVTMPSSVTSIIGLLVLQNDPALADLGLDRLQRVGSLIDIEDMASLETIELPALTQVQKIEVSGNGALRHLGLPALPGPATIFVSGNPHLPACEVDALFARVPGTHEQNGNDETATCTGTP